LQAATASAATDNSIFQDMIFFPLLLMLISRCRCPKITAQAQFFSE